MRTMISFHIGAHALEVDSFVVISRCGKSLNWPRQCWSWSYGSSESQECFVFGRSDVRRSIVSLVNLQRRVETYPLSANEKSNAPFELIHADVWYSSVTSIFRYHHYSYLFHRWCYKMHMGVPNVVSWWFIGDVWKLTLSDWHKVWWKNLIFRFGKRRVSL